MTIIINHLTRMQQGFFCVAGIEEGTGRHVRPVLSDGQLSTELLAVHGGQFDMALRLDIGRVKTVGRPPHIEDHTFRPHLVARVGRVSGGHFWQLLSASAQLALDEVFGHAVMRARNGTCSTGPGTGDASLGCIRPDGVPRLRVETKPNRSPQIRISFRDRWARFDASLTDIRLFQDDHVTPDLDKVNRLPEIMEQSAELILSVGLTREYNGAHWVQVNNIHIREYPLWRLGG